VAFGLALFLIEHRERVTMGNSDRLADVSPGVAAERQPGPGCYEVGR